MNKDELKVRGDLMAESVKRAVKEVMDNSRSMAEVSAVFGSGFLACLGAYKIRDEEGALESWVLFKHKAKELVDYE